jgi:uncharacterized protein
MGVLNNGPQYNSQPVLLPAGEHLMWRTGLVVVISLLSAPAWAFDCGNATLPSSIVICSDPELIRIADERQQAVNEARERLSPEQFRALLDEQNAWIRTYARACGVPPDEGPPELPVSRSMKACFKRAGEERTAYIRSYGSQASPAPSTAPMQSASDRLGPGFDCSANARTPLTQMICADPELSRADLAFNQAYWALYQDIDEADRKQLRNDDNEFLAGVDPSGFRR